MEDLDIKAFVLLLLIMNSTMKIIRSDLSLHSCSPCSELETVMDANPEVQRNKGDGVTAAPENNAAGVQVPDNAEVSHSGDFGPWMLAQPRRGKRFGND